jgi:hypothetical protein
MSTDIREDYWDRVSLTWWEDNILLAEKFEQIQGKSIL